MIIVYLEMWNEFSASQRFPVPRSSEIDVMNTVYAIVCVCVCVWRYTYGMSHYAYDQIRPQLRVCHHHHHHMYLKITYLRPVHWSPPPILAS
jgi:hypothetical protein